MQQQKVTTSLAQPERMAFYRRGHDARAGLVQAISRESGQRDLATLATFPPRLPTPAPAGTRPDEPERKGRKGQEGLRGSDGRLFYPDSVEEAMAFHYFTSLGLPVRGYSYKRDGVYRYDCLDGGNHLWIPDLVVGDEVWEVKGGKSLRDALTRECGYTYQRMVTTVAKFLQYPAVLWCFVSTPHPATRIKASDLMTAADLLALS